MSFALVRKELREHGFIVAVALAIGALAYFGFVADAEKQGGRFNALARYASSIGTLNALVLANRLFAREYAGRTQLFLETLPLSRARVFATKWLLGFGVVALTTVLVWFATLAWVRKREVLAWDDAVRTLLCVGLFALAMWSWSAMAGMLGRYRYVAWIAAALALFAAKTVAGLEEDELPVLRLLGPDVVMARGTPGARELLQAGAVVLVSTAAAAALALVGSGAMASALARRMTARERVFVWVSFIATMLILSSLDPKPIKPPFALRNAVSASGAAFVSVMPTGDLSNEAALDLAYAIIADVRALRDALGFDAKPTVAIVPQQGLDRAVIQRAWLDRAEGIALRAAPDAPRQTLRAYVLHSLLIDETLQRAGREDRHALLDGLSAYVVLHGDLEGRERYWLRAATAPGPLRAESLTRWEETSERLGTCVADALAFAVVDVLAEQLGRARLFELMRALFRKPHDDVRVLFETSPATLLARAGTSWESLAARTERALQAARTRHAAALAQRPQLRARIWAGKSAASGRTLEAELHGASSYWVEYTLLQPWTAETDALSRFDARTPHVVLPLSPPRRARAFAAIEVDDGVLGCPVRVLARRMRLP